MEYIIQTQNLSKRYFNPKGIIDKKSPKKFIALDKANINVPKGSIYGLVGKNGAGKTTLIRVLCGLQNPTEGSFAILGVENTESKMIDVRRKIGMTIENPAVYPDLTAEKNMMVQYDILGLKNYNSIKDILKFVGLEDTQGKPVKSFSLGMKQRLAIAIALSGNPELLILDEPINGLDPEGIVEIRNLIIKLNKERNMTILLSSHILEELSKIATHYGFISDGTIVQELSAEELENAVQKETHMWTKDGDAESVLKQLNKNPFKKISDNHFVLYDNVIVTPLVIYLHNHGVIVERISENEQSLEEYFLNLVGGEK